MRSPFFIGAISLVAVLILMIYGIAVLAPLNPEVNGPDADELLLTPLSEPGVDFGNPILGAMDAPVTIVEFGDFNCAACAALDVSLTTILEEYVGDVRLVWKDLPNTGLHSAALDASLAARCADDQGAFWQFHGILLSRPGSVIKENMVPFAAELGLDLDDFQSCLDEERGMALIRRDREEAIRLRVDATPYLFINGRRVTGAVSIEQLRGFIDAELAKIARERAAQESGNTDAPTPSGATP